MFEQHRFRKLKNQVFSLSIAFILANIFFSWAFVYFPFVLYLAPYYEYVASYLSNSASLRVKYGFANGD